MGESRTYRKFSAQQKTELVLASLRGPKTIAQICREHDISESLLGKWREQFLAAGAEVIVGVEMPPDSVRLNVEDAGRGGAIAPRPPDPEGGGFGLNLVQALSERWGIERAAQGGTCVWAQLARAPLTALAS